MNPRTLSQIITELNPTFNPQIQALEQRAAQIPGQIASEEAGLQARQTEAFDNILSGARRRGTGIAFGGIPLGEQARYTATEYLPSLARLRQSGVEQRMSLQDAINQIRERRDTLAQQIFQTEQDRAESARQAAASRAAMASPSLGNLFGGQQSQAVPQLSQRDDKGFNFTDASGRPISAALYSQMTGIPFRQLLQSMADSGDRGAATALRLVGDDYGYNPTKVGTDQNAINVLNSLLWGVNNVTPYQARQTGAGQSVNSIMSTLPLNPNLVIGARR